MAVISVRVPSCREMFTNANFIRDHPYQNKIGDRKEWLPRHRCTQNSSSTPPRYFFPATILAHMDSDDPDPLEHQAEFFNIMEVCAYCMHL